ncbi:hypothetical protein EGW08_018589 [Elysia chlorotica]|uniref:C2H2-type domain-containing protein n=1 Tax=Elysia chlorotica TaxID=188477 RepID=A0A3S0ZRM0_ELYCH|nr:hypothetical protein EGW08_018589 [Elysia chlorotica]
MIKHQKSGKVQATIIHIRMSGKVGDHFYCICCDSKFNKEADFNNHCNSKKHKNNERIRSEQDAAAASVLVRGVKGCKNMKEFLASYFCKFGLLAKVSAIGPENHGIGRVQYVQPEVVAEVLKAGKVHRHLGSAFRVSRFEYKPRGGDAMRVAAKEEVKRQETAREELHASIMQILEQESAVEEQMAALTEELSLTWEDFLNRQGIVVKLKEVFTPSHPEVAVHMFGSSFNGFGTQGCDLDLFLNIDLDTPADKKVLKTLQQVLTTRELSKTFSEVIFVPSTRCPIIKFIHKPTGIQCDLSLNNKKALYNTRLLRLYATDPRVRQVVFAVRLWAKFRGLSGRLGPSNSNLLTSYALTLLALYYLTRCKPEPVLPPVCDLNDCVPGILEETVEDVKCLIIPENAQLPPSKNTMSSVELLRGFFHFYSKEINWAQDAILMKDASIASRASLNQNFDYLNCRIGAMTVIDPFDLAHNVTSNVNENFRELLTNEMKRAAELSSGWLETDEPSPLGMQGLFELANLEVSDKNQQNNEEGGTPKDPKKGKKSKSKKKTPMRMEGEQENGDFHIILPMSHATLVSETLKEMATPSGLSAKQCWLNKARDLALRVLETVFLVEMEQKAIEKTEGGAEMESKMEAAESGDQIENGMNETLSCETYSEKKADMRLVDELKGTGEVEMEVEQEANKACCHGKKRSNENLVDIEIPGDQRSRGLGETYKEISSSSIEDEMPKKRLCFAGVSQASSRAGDVSVSNVCVTSPSTIVSMALSYVTTTLTASTPASSGPALTTICSPSTAPHNTPLSTTERRSAIPPPDLAQALPSQSHISFSCKCRYPVWHGRKKLKEEIMLDADPAIYSGSGITLETEISQRCVKQLTASPTSQTASTALVSVKPPDSTASQDALNKYPNAAFAEESASSNIEEKVTYSSHDSSTMGSNGGENSAASPVKSTGAYPNVIQNSTASDKSDKSSKHTNPSPIVLPEPEISEETTNLSQIALIVSNKHVNDENADQHRLPASSSKEASVDPMSQQNQLSELVHKSSDVILETSNTISQPIPNLPKSNISCSALSGDAKTDMLNSNLNISTVQTGTKSGAHTHSPSSKGGQAKSLNSSLHSGNKTPEPNSDPQGIKEELCLEFTCDLVLNGGESTPVENDNGTPQPYPHLLIKLRPSESSTKNFKVFYDVFRSLMLRFNASELNNKSE